MNPRLALYLMPSFAVLATAVIVLGPGRERPAFGARVWGLPAEGAKSTALRISTMEREFGADRALAVTDLTVTLSQGGKVLGSWFGDSGEDGIAEATIALQEGLSGAIDARVTRGQAVLADGPIQVQPSQRVNVARSFAAGKNQGLVWIQVDVEGGVLAAPFPGLMRVHVSRDGPPVPAAKLVVAVTGADVEGAPGGTRELTADAGGNATLRLTPTWHAVEVKVEATDPRSDPPVKGTWDGGLTVKPGAMTLSPAGTREGDGWVPAGFEVRSPVPRDRAYVSVMTWRGRVFGAVVPLSPDGKGFHRGTLTVPSALRGEVAAVTVAGDAEEQGAGTVAWPLQSVDAVFATPAITRLLDGVPLAERAEKKRASTARLVSVGVAFAAALFEAVLLVLYSRESQRRLSAHLEAQIEDLSEREAAARIAAAPGSRAFMLVTAIGLVVLGFGAVAAFAIVK